MYFGSENVGDSDYIFGSELNLGNFSGRSRLSIMSNKIDNKDFPLEPESNSTASQISWFQGLLDFVENNNCLQNQVNRQKWFLSQEFINLYISL